MKAGPWDHKRHIKILILSASKFLGKIDIARGLSPRNMHPIEVSKRRVDGNEIEDNDVLENFNKTFI